MRSATQRQWPRAIGYTLIFLMPTLLVVGTVTGRPYLAFGVAFFVLPLMRMAFGTYGNAHELAWRESIATVLHWLPVSYAVILVGSLIVVAASFGAGAVEGASAHIGMGLSLWITLLFGLCSAHELLHRRRRTERLAGAALAGALGYPAMALEHPMHHAREGAVDMAESPRFEESVWAFAARRIQRIARELQSTLWGPTGNSLTSPLRTQLLVALTATGAVLLCFFALAGLPGLATYVVAAMGCTLGLQIMTYLQHWALSDPRWVGAQAQPLAWEDDCQFQAWITLHISFHQRHHQDAAMPYYRLGLDRASPRLPAGYILMMVICLVPSVWRKAMLPALEEWAAGPAAPQTAGRRLTCFGLYRVANDSARKTSES